jgi:hypothetical protein
MRWRLPSSGSPDVSPPTQSYTHAGGVARPLPAASAGDSSALTTTAITPDGADHLALGDTYHFQGVSKSLAAQTIPSGMQLKLALQCLEANAGNNLFLQLWVGIYDRAGSSLLATLLAKTVDATELNTTIQNRFLNPTTTAGYTCTGGERLVIELSVRGTPSAAGGTQGHNASLRFGSNGAGGDLPENDTEAGATFNPWFETSSDLTFETLTGGLIAYWPLDETSGTRADAHSGGYTLTDGNTVGSSTGKIGTAASFVDANAEYLNSSAAGLNLSTTDSYSISVWVSPTSSYFDYLTIANDIGNGDRKIYLLTLPTTGYLQRYNGVSTTTAPPLDTWTHVVYTFQSSGTNTGTEKIYVNGSEVGTRTGAVPAPGASGLEIGRDTTGGNHSWNGLLDEFGFWRRCLSPTEVTQLYNSGAGLEYPFTPAATTFNAEVMTATASAPAATPALGVTFAAGVMTASASAPAATGTGGATLFAAAGTSAAALPVATLTEGGATVTFSAGVLAASAASAAATTATGVLFSAGAMTASSAAPGAAVSGGAQALATTATATAMAPALTMTTGAVFTAGVMTATASAPAATTTLGTVVSAGVMVASVAEMPTAAVFVTELPRIWAELVTAPRRSLLVRAGLPPDAEYDL